MRGMTEQTIILTAAIAFSAGSMSVGMWLGARLARVATDRNRLQAERDWLLSEVNHLRGEVANVEAMTDKIAQLTADCVELQTLAHEAHELASMEKERADNLIQDCVVLGDIVRADDGSVAMLAAERKKLEMAKGMIAGEIAAHATTKRQLAAARGQITKLRKRLE